MFLDRELPADLGAEGITLLLLARDVSCTTISKYQLCNLQEVVLMMRPMLNLRGTYSRVGILVHNIYLDGSGSLASREDVLRKSIVGGDCQFGCYTLV
jgi:hypothetical protein